VALFEIVAEDLQAFLVEAQGRSSSCHSVELAHICAKQESREGSKTDLVGDSPIYVRVEASIHSADMVVLSGANKDTSLVISNSPVLRVASQQCYPIRHYSQPTCRRGRLLAALRHIQCRQRLTVLCHYGQRGSAR
jgi:hypothetical protein